MVFFVCQCKKCLCLFFSPPSLTYLSNVLSCMRFLGRAADEFQKSTALISVIFLSLSALTWKSSTASPSGQLGTPLCQNRSWSICFVWTPLPVDGFSPSWTSLLWCWCEVKVRTSLHFSSLLKVWEKITTTFFRVSCFYCGASEVNPAALTLCGNVIFNVFSVKTGLQLLKVIFYRGNTFPTEEEAGPLNRSLILCESPRQEEGQRSLV